MNLESAAAHFLDGYFSTCRRSEKTHAAYGIDLAQFKAFCGSDQLLNVISVETLERWAAELTYRKYAPESVRRKFATLRVFFGYWVRKGDLDTSPLWRIRLDLGRQPLLPRGLMASDAKRLLDGAWAGVAAHRLVHCEPRDRGFLALRNLVALELLFATGMRVGELVSLRLKDWREDDQSFVVQGKGDRQRLAILPDDRSVAAVQAYLPKRRALQVGQDALLLNAAGRPLSTQGVARVLDRFAHQAGVPTHVTPHMIRHTVATLLLRHGADIRVVQEVLGHTSITTTQRYTHVSKEHLMETLRAHHPSRHMSVTTSALGIPA